MSEKKPHSEQELFEMEKQYHAIGEQMDSLVEKVEGAPVADKVKALQKVRELDAMREKLDKQMRRSSKELLAQGFKKIPYQHSSKEFSEYLEMKGLSVEELAQDRSGQYWEGSTLIRH